MNLRRRSLGMSMVELMVAMAIALIGTIIIFQVFEVSEGIRRTTTSGGDAQQNGVLATYMMEADLRNAGMGFNDTAFAGCAATAYDSTRAPTGFTLQMSPVSITGGGNARTPDSLSVFYGSQFGIANATTLSAPMGNTIVNLKVANRYGFRLGDLLLLVQPGITPVPCELVEVTSLPDVIGQLDEVGHAQTPYTLNWVPSGPVGTISRFNPGGGTTRAYGGAGALATRVFNIGNPYDSAGTFNLSGPSTPVYNTYAVDSTTNSLTVRSAFSGAAANPVADNIVHFRALYGLDDGVNNGTVPYSTTFVANDGLVDRYVDAATWNAMPTKPWANLSVVKIAIVARSALPEKPSAGAGAPCDTTAAAPTWSATPWAAANGFIVELDLSADANWQCYRYRVFESTVPLRNWIWKSS